MTKQEIEEMEKRDAAAYARIAKANP